MKPFLNSAIALAFTASFSYLAVGAETVLHIQPDVSLSLRAGPHEASSVARSRYFRTYHIPGMFSDARNEELRSLNVSPARGTGPYFGDPGGDTQRVAWDSRINVQIDHFVKLYRRAETFYPGIVHAMAGGSYPTVTHTGKDQKATGVDATMATTHDRTIPREKYDEAAGLISRWLKAIEDAGAPKPRYFSSANEPDASWRVPPQQQNHADFARALALRLATDHPDVRLSGPCTAWPYPGEEWKRWLGTSWERTFITSVGDVAGAYDFHFYSKELWAYGSESPGFQQALAQSSPNLYDSLFKGHKNLWEFGKVDSYLDLIYAYHQSRWNRPSLPVIVSEFGRQGITPQKGPWPNDYLHYLYGTTVTRLWMRFMDRPEIELTVPFILPDADPGHAPLRGQALYNQPGAPEDKTWKATPLLGFYGFFRNFSGTRVALDWSGLEEARALGVFTIAAREGDELRVLLHNAPSIPLTFALDLPGTAGPARIARMRWEAQVPTDFRATFTGGWRRDQSAKETINLKNISLAGEETALLIIPLTPGTAPTNQCVVERFYSSETMGILQADKTTEANVTLPAMKPNSTVELILNLAFPAGPKSALPLRLMVNGKEVPEVSTPAFLTGWEAVFHPLRVTLPSDLLTQGANRISVNPASTSPLPAHSYLASARIDVSTTIPNH
jgi:hypothetical protein